LPSELDKEDLEVLGRSRLAYLLVSARRQVLAGAARGARGDTSLLKSLSKSQHKFSESLEAEADKFEEKYLKEID